MKARSLFIATALVLSFAVISHAEVTIATGHNGMGRATPAFTFATVPSPSKSDAATKAIFTILEGAKDPNGGGLAKLHDGRLPTDQDGPSENFFLRAGTAGGRLLINLGKSIAIKQVNTYSWHPTTRGPQVYTLYASEGTAGDFNPRPPTETDPAECGWKLIARIDTRPKEGRGGGQYGVSISDSRGTLGTYRYLLFAISRTEADDPFGNTFYSEIDVVDPTSPVVAATPYAPAGAQTFEAGGGKYQIIIDTSETPDLQDWAQKELAPVLQMWYPKIAAMLPSDGYEAPRRVQITFRQNMRGVAATGGTRVSCAASWYRQNLKGEAKGSVVHELVHVVQQYGRARRARSTRTPGWLVEGIADYIRWFLYEPETHGAAISRRNASRARYDASYRISANFLDWVTRTHDKDIVKKLNAAAREGRYEEDLWKQYTGHTVQELGEKWKESLMKAASE